MTLTEVLGSIHISCEDQRIIEGISDDSRMVAKDWLFLARKGVEFNGMDYVLEALKKGAIVLWEKETGLNQYHCEHLEGCIPILLNTYYNHPSQHLHVVGITGTNGKTSVACILKQLLEMSGRNCMMIGTGSIQYLDQHITISNTTPSACVLAYYFSLARKLNIPWIVMEVSSHAIDQGRIDFIQFDYVLFTNIAKDHLDYHHTRTHYQYTKFKLRKYLKEQGVIILNHDYAYMHSLYQMQDDKIITFGCDQAHIQITDIKLNVNHSVFAIMDINYDTSLLGMVNVYNICEALIVMRNQGIDRGVLQSYVANLKGVPGRLQVFKIQSFYVWIDYAHTQSSLYELLKFAKKVCLGRLISIIGCGGNRDHEKRELMARTTHIFSDISILSTDNPRDEEAYRILLEMVGSRPQDYVIIENRKCAVNYAMKIAQKNDIIVIAGKGNEDYQLIRGKKYAFSDVACIEEYQKMEAEINDI